MRLRNTKLHTPAPSLVLAVIFSATCLFSFVDLTGPQVTYANEDSDVGIRPGEEKPFGRHPQQAEGRDGQAETAALSGLEGTDKTTTEAIVQSQPPDSIVAYYFHRTYRCERCIKMEAYILAVIHLNHSEDLASGALRWRVLDFEDPVNSRYAENYELGGPALVLSHWAEGKEVRWTRLDEIWDLLDDPGALVGHIGQSIKARLDEGYGHD